jgi:predicted dehydrogenase
MSQKGHSQAAKGQRAEITVVIGVGIVGCNYGRTVLIPAFRHHTRCEVVALGGDLAEIAGLAAREQPVEIAGVVSCYSAGEELHAAVLAFGAVDAVMVTSLENPHEAFAAAVVAFGSERVYVPALLGIEPAITAPAGER